MVALDPEAKDEFASQTAAHNVGKVLQNAVRCVSSLLSEPHLVAKAVSSLEFRTTYWVAVRDAREVLSRALASLEISANCTPGLDKALALTTELQDLRESLRRRGLAFADIHWAPVGSAVAPLPPLSVDVAAEALLAGDGYARMPVMLADLVQQVHEREPYSVLRLSSQERSDLNRRAHDEVVSLWLLSRCPKSTTRLILDEGRFVFAVPNEFSVTSIYDFHRWQILEAEIRLPGVPSVRVPAAAHLGFANILRQAVGLLEARYEFSVERKKREYRRIVRLLADLYQKQREHGMRDDDAIGTAVFDRIIRAELRRKQLLREIQSLMDFTAECAGDAASSGRPPANPTASVSEEATATSSLFGASRPREATPLLMLSGGSAASAQVLQGVPDYFTELYTLGRWTVCGVLFEQLRDQVLRARSSSDVYPGGVHRYRQIGSTGFLAADEANGEGRPAATSEAASGGATGLAEDGASDPAGFHEKNDMPRESDAAVDAGLNDDSRSVARRSSTGDESLSAPPSVTELGCSTLDPTAGTLRLASLASAFSARSETFRAMDVYLMKHFDFSVGGILTRLIEFILFDLHGVVPFDLHSLLTVEDAGGAEATGVPHLRLLSVRKGDAGDESAGDEPASQASFALKGCGAVLRYRLDRRTGHWKVLLWPLSPVLWVLENAHYLVGQGKATKGQPMDDGEGNALGNTDSSGRTITLAPLLADLMLLPDWQDVRDVLTADQSVNALRHFDAGNLELSQWSRQAASALSSLALLFLATALRARAKDPLQSLSAVSLNCPVGTHAAHRSLRIAFFDRYIINIRVSGFDGTLLLSFQTEPWAMRQRTTASPPRTGAAGPTAEANTWLRVPGTVASLEAEITAAMRDGSRGMQFLLDVLPYLKFMAFADLVRGAWLEKAGEELGDVPREVGYGRASAVAGKTPQAPQLPTVDWAVLGKPHYAPPAETAASDARGNLYHPPRMAVRIFPPAESTSLLTVMQACQRMHAGNEQRSHDPRPVFANSLGLRGGLSFLIGELSFEETTVRLSLYVDMDNHSFGGFAIVGCSVLVTRRSTGRGWTVVARLPVDVGSGVLPVRLRRISGNDSSCSGEDEAAGARRDSLNPAAGTERSNGTGKNLGNSAVVTDAPPEAVFEEGKHEALWAAVQAHLASTSTKLPLIISLALLSEADFPFTIRSMDDDVDDSETIKFACTLAQNASEEPSWAEQALAWDPSRISESDDAQNFIAAAQQENIFTGLRVQITGSQARAQFHGCLRFPSFRASAEEVAAAEIGAKDAAAASGPALAPRPGESARALRFDNVILNGVFFIEAAASTCPRFCCREIHFELPLAETRTGHGRDSCGGVPIAAPAGGGASVSEGTAVSVDVKAGSAGSAPPPALAAAPPPDASFASAPFRDTFKTLFTRLRLHAEMLRHASSLERFEVGRADFTVLTALPALIRCAWEPWPFLLPSPAASGAVKYEQVRPSPVLFEWKLGDENAYIPRPYTATLLHGSSRDISVSVQHPLLGPLIAKRAPILQAWLRGGSTEASNFVQCVMQVFEFHATFAMWSAVYASCENLPAEEQKFLPPPGRWQRVDSESGGALGEECLVLNCNYRSSRAMGMSFFNGVTLRFVLASAGEHPSMGAPPLSVTVEATATAAKSLPHASGLLTRSLNSALATMAEAVGAAYQDGPTGESPVSPSLMGLARLAEPESLSGSRHALYYWPGRFLHDVVLPITEAVAVWLNVYPISANIHARAIRTREGCFSRGGGSRSTESSASVNSPVSVGAISWLHANPPNGAADTMYTFELRCLARPADVVPAGCFADQVRYRMHPPQPSHPIFAAMPPVPTLTAASVATPFASLSRAWTFSQIKQAAIARPAPDQVLFQNDCDADLRAASTEEMPAAHLWHWNPDFNVALVPIVDGPFHALGVTSPATLVLKKTQPKFGASNEAVMRGWAGCVAKPSNRPITPADAPLLGYPSSASTDVVCRGEIFADATPEQRARSLVVSDYVAEWPRSLVLQYEFDRLCSLGVAPTVTAANEAPQNVAEARPVRSNSDAGGEPDGARKRRRVIGPAPVAAAPPLAAPPPATPPPLFGEALLQLARSLTAPPLRPRVARRVDGNFLPLVFESTLEVTSSVPEQPAAVLARYARTVGRCVAGNETVSLVSRFLQETPAAGSAADVLSLFELVLASLEIHAHSVLDLMRGGTPRGPGAAGIGAPPVPRLFVPLLFVEIRAPSKLTIAPSGTSGPPVIGFDLELQVYKRLPLFLRDSSVLSPAGGTEHFIVDFQMPVNQSLAPFVNGRLSLGEWVARIENALPGLFNRPGAIGDAQRPSQLSVVLQRPLVNGELISQLTNATTSRERNQAAKQLKKFPQAPKHHLDEEHAAKNFKVREHSALQGFVCFRCDHVKQTKVKVTWTTSEGPKIICRGCYGALVSRRDLTEAQKTLRRAAAGRPV